MMLLVANEYVGRGRGNVGGVVGGELPVRGMGRQEVDEVGRGGIGEKEEEEERKCSRQHCCHVSESSAERFLRYTCQVWLWP